MQTSLSLRTAGQGLYDFTRSVADWLADAGAKMAS